MRITSLIERNANNRVDRFVMSIGLVFPNTNETVVCMVVKPVSVEQGSFGGKRFGNLSRNLSVKPLVSEVGEIENAVGNEIRRATILMDSCPGIKRLRREDLSRPIIMKANNRTPSAFSWATFNPVDLVSIEGNLSKLDRF